MRKERHVELPRLYAGWKWSQFAIGADIGCKRLGPLLLEGTGCCLSENYGRLARTCLRACLPIIGVIAKRQVEPTRAFSGSRQLVCLPQVCGAELVALC